MKLINKKFRYAIGFYPIASLLFVIVASNTGVGIKTYMNIPSSIGLFWVLSCIIVLITFTIPLFIAFFTKKVKKLMDNKR